MSLRSSILKLSGGDLYTRAGGGGLKLRGGSKAPPKEVTSMGHLRRRPRLGCPEEFSPSFLLYAGLLADHGGLASVETVLGLPCAW